MSSMSELSDGLGQAHERLGNVEKMVTRKPKVIHIKRGPDGMIQEAVPEYDED